MGVGVSCLPGEEVGTGAGVPKERGKGGFDAALTAAITANSLARDAL